jgi:Astacin (Peptidase family M12A)
MRDPSSGFFRAPEQGGGTAGDADTLDLPAGMFRSGDNIEECTAVIPRRLIGPVNLTVKFTELNGNAIFEGDIVLGAAEVARGPGVDAEGRGIGIPGEQYRWPRGIVAYVTQEALRSRVEAAIAHWEQHTPFQFKPRTDEQDYLSFEAHDGCWSRVGRQGGVQVISLGAGCGRGPAVHEIGHSLGLWHEQSRSDRDDFIRIVQENIDPTFVHNFDKHIQDGTDLGAYDYGSIMHYPATAFSINGQPTIVAKDGQPIGQRYGLSAGDIEAVRLMYPDLDWE